MGRRLIRSWIGNPLLDIERILQRLDQVEVFYEDGIFRAEIREALNNQADLERLANRIAASSAGPRDLVSLRKNLASLPPIKMLLEKVEKGPLVSILERIDLCEDIHELLKRAIADDPPATLTHIGVIQSGYSEELDGVVESSREARDWIAKLESVERELTGIKTLKVGYNKVFGYYIEVTKANTKSVPDSYIRKQTLVNAERYITPEMKDYESRVLTAEERIRKIETELFRDLCARIGGESARLIATARSLARLDVVSALAETASNRNYVRPEILEENILEIEYGRHPVVERFLEVTRFVPNDTVYEEGERIRVLTGPNMSGKSTYLRQVALIALMAQMGSYVPAQSARIGLVDRIFTRIGAQDEIFAGQSTFMVEMVETANILHHATNRSLLVLDEIGRGTSTYDGVSIAWAVVEYIHNHPRIRARTLFATHYHELTNLAEILPGVRNYNIAVSDEGGEVIFLHKILPGGADKSYGIHVAELAGLPRAVINRAQEILNLFERESREVQSRERLPIHQLELFPTTHPLIEELEKIDVASLTPLEAINRLYEWQNRFLSQIEEESSEGS
jgi:DNA mismatch repair protein MutS